MANDKWPVIEMFESIQGEGPRIGTPSIFIRVAGCNLRCPACDTKYSWERIEPTWTLDQIELNLRYATGKDIVLTGGEPLLYPDLVRALAVKITPNILWVETNATIPPLLQTGCGLQYYTVSPKLPWFDPDYPTNSDVLERFATNYRTLAWKFVVRAQRGDVFWVRDFYRRYLKDQRGTSHTIVLQPDGHQLSSSSDDWPWPYAQEHYINDLRIIADLTQDVLWNVPNVRVLPQLHTLLYRGERGK